MVPDSLHWVWDTGFDLIAKYYSVQFVGKEDNWSLGQGKIKQKEVIKSHK